MPPRTVALVAAVCVTLGWLFAATLTPPVARLQSLTEGQRPPEATAYPFTERLNLGLREAPQAPVSKRNPFNFGSPRRAPSAPPTDAISLESAPPDAVPTPPAFVYSLSGIGIAGHARTAVLTDGQTVLIVKVNDTVGEYAVVEITDDSVRLESDVSRHILRLAQ